MTRENQAIDSAGEIMLDFARLTGLEPEGSPPRRYLWTAAFAVCNFLELHRRTGEALWRELALRLVGQVHRVLGRHRPDGSRGGWLSGLDEEEGALHPTAGGLRIGKRLEEQQPGEPVDERLEWDRDGQYYHYLTKWMHALHRVSRLTGEESYLSWAIELAQAAHAGFAYAPIPGGARRLHWKMSCDLSRPQVPSMGQHDPLNGLVTCCELATAAREHPEARLPGLEAEIGELALICRGRQWETDDALGIGGLLCDASRIAQLMSRGYRELPRLDQMAEAALSGLDFLSAGNLLELPGRYRLAFRELGLAIGLKAIGLLPPRLAEETLGARRPALARYLPLAEGIERFWLEGSSQGAGSGQEHREINMVMLATSLAPAEFLAAC